MKRQNRLRSFLIRTCLALSLLMSQVQAAILPDCDDSRFPDVFGSRNGIATEYFGMDILETGNSPRQLEVIVAVGAIGDPTLIKDEMSSKKTLSYEVSASKPAPMINLFHTDVDIQPTTFVVDLGNSAVNGHKFLDVAILRDSNDKLTTYKSEWNIPTYSSNT